MRKKFNPHKIPPWVKQFSAFGRQFIIPFTIFQAIRTIIFPTFLDVLLLTLFIFLAASVFFDVF